MLQVEAIDARCVQQLRPSFCLILRDHLLTAAGIAGQAVAAHRVVLRNHAHRHQRCRRRNEAGRMTARVRYTLTRANRRPLRFRQLWIAIGPVWIRPVCRRRIDHAHVRIINEGNRFSGTFIRQTEKYDICAVEILLPLIRIVPELLRNPQQFEILALTDTVIDLKSRRATLTIDINFRLHDFLP